VATHASRADNANSLTDSQDARLRSRSARCLCGRAQALPECDSRSIASAASMASRASSDRTADWGCSHRAGSSCHHQVRGTATINITSNRTTATGFPLLRENQRTDVTLRLGARGSPRRRRVRILAVDEGRRGIRLTALIASRAAKLRPDLRTLTRPADHAAMRWADREPRPPMPRRRRHARRAPCARRLRRYSSCSRRAQTPGFLEATPRAGTRPPTH
jgi:hypothetical protein